MMTNSKLILNALNLISQHFQNFQDHLQKIFLPFFDAFLDKNA